MTENVEVMEMMKLMVAWNVNLTMTAVAASVTLLVAAQPENKQNHLFPVIKRYRILAHIRAERFQ